MNNKRLERDGGMWNKIGWVFVWLNIASAALSVWAGKYLFVFSGVVSAALIYYTIRSNEKFEKLLSEMENNND